jgi:ABC-2 type transport system permease protein
MADCLAGIDAPHYADFIQAVNQFEDQWRDYFVPKIMGAMPWSEQQQTAIPSFSFNTARDLIDCWRLSFIQMATALILFSVLFALWRQFAKT